MRESLTAGAERALAQAENRARHRGSSQVDPADLLVALVREPDSRAGTLLREFGMDPQTVLGVLHDDVGALAETANPDAGHEPPVAQSAAVRSILQEASRLARAVARGRGIATEHLLLSLLDESAELAALLDKAGLRVGDLLQRLDHESSECLVRIPFPADVPPIDLFSAAEAVDIGRILDAAANRVREGLRVAEDYVRFVLNDPGLTRRMKEVRHRLTTTLSGLDSFGLIASRDTRGDVGTHITTPTEQFRENARAVLTANFKRCGEALRTLEEFTKLVDAWISSRFEGLRYDIYILEKLVMTAVAAHQAIGNARLYVLVGGLPTMGDLTWIVGEALAGGAELIQLREKGLPDRVVIERARLVRRLTSQANARFILNDRPDLARLAGADGVHLGQDDLSPRDARRAVGPAALLGVSTHDRAQLDSAILDGAGYLGVGPVFPGETKAFDEFAGLEFVRQAAASTALPWFAIGGINESNLDDVLDAGAQRIAVGAAVVRADRPRQAATRLRARLDALG